MTMYPAKDSTGNLGSMMRKILIITRFELWQRLRSPLLFVMMLISPALTLMTNLPHQMSQTEFQQPQQSPFTILLGGASHKLLDSLNEYFLYCSLRDKQPLSAVVLPLNSDDLNQGRYDLVAIVMQNSAPRVRTQLPDASGSEYTLQIVRCDLRMRTFVPVLRSAIELSSTPHTLTRLAVSYADDASEQSIKTSSEKVHPATMDDERASQSWFVFALLSFQILSITLISGNGQQLLRSMFEERASCLLDVVLSSSSASSLLLAKYLSILILGLIHTALWLGLVSVLSHEVFDRFFFSSALIIAVHAYLSFSVFSALYLYLSVVVERESTAQVVSALSMFALILPLSFIAMSSQTSLDSVMTIFQYVPLLSISAHTVTQLSNWQHGTINYNFLPYVYNTLCTALFIFAAVKGLKGRVSGSMQTRKQHVIAS